MSTYLKSSAGATSDAGEGHINIHCTVQIGHTIHEGHQRLQCWLFSDKTYYGSNQEDFVFNCQLGVELFVLSQDNMSYCWLKLLFTLSFHIDEFECAYVPFCYQIKLEPSGIT